MSAANPGWLEWVSHVTAVCGMTVGDRPMLTNWCRILAGAGATPAEVIDATDWVALNDPQAWRPNLLAALKRRLDALHAEPAAPAEPCPDAQGCAICGGLDAAGFPREATGRVLVPDPDRLPKRKTCVVYCRCPLGRWFRSASPRIMVRGVECSVLTIDDICQRFEDLPPAPGQEPGYRGYLLWWQQLRAAEDSAAADAREGDRRDGRLRWRRIASFLAAPGPNQPRTTEAS
jgi:hypothetical protein